MTAAHFPPHAPRHGHGSARRVSSVKRRVKTGNFAHIDLAYEQEKERVRLSRLHTQGSMVRLLDSLQPWIVTVVSGVLVGLTAAYLDLLSVWISDVRTGICREQPFLSRSACCTGLDRAYILSSSVKKAVLTSHSRGALSKLAVVVRGVRWSQRGSSLISPLSHLPRWRRLPRYHGRFLRASLCAVRLSYGCVRRSRAVMHRPTSRAGIPEIKVN